MAFKKKAPIVILGAGITGLAVAAKLEKAGLDYYLVDAQDFGGLVKGQTVHESELDYGLKSIPVTSAIDANPLIALKNELDLKIQIESFNDAPKYFDNKTFSEFVGFGENKNRNLIEELGYYTLYPRILVSGGWKNLVAELSGHIPEDKKITGAHITRLEVKDENVVSISINGESTITAQKFIFTLSPTHFKDMLALGTLSGKLLQRIARTEPFTAISLDLATPQPIGTDKNIFVLRDFSKTSEEETFILGQFTSNIDPSRPSKSHISTWLTLVEPEALLEDENGSKVIKNMKKIIAKAFPKLIESAIWERLLVVPDALGSFNQLTLEKNSTLPGLSNLWVCGGKVQSEYKNIGAALDSAGKVAKSVIEESQKPIAADTVSNSPEASL